MLVVSLSESWSILVSWKSTQVGLELLAGGRYVPASPVAGMRASVTFWRLRAMYLTVPRSIVYIMRTGHGRIRNAVASDRSVSVEAGKVR